MTLNNYALALGTPVGSPVVPPAGTVVLPMTKLPYTTAQFAASTPNGVSSRVVGCGLRIRYIGSDMARSGQIVGWRHLDNETLVGLNGNDIRANSTAKTYPNDRDWLYVCYRPAKPAEYEFSNYSCVDAEGPGTLYKYPMGFWVDGTSNTTGGPGPAPFEWEYIQYIEYIGEIDTLTKSHVDVVGMSDIRNSLPEKSTYQDVDSEKRRMARALTETIYDRSGIPHSFNRQAVMPPRGVPKIY